MLGFDRNLTFTPHLIPLDQGELVSCYVTLTRSAPHGEVDNGIRRDSARHGEGDNCIEGGALTEVDIDRSIERRTRMSRSSS